MKDFVFFKKGLMAVMLFTFLIPAGLIAQGGSFTVQIIHPVGPLVKKCMDSDIPFGSAGINSDGSTLTPETVTFRWEFGDNTAPSFAVAPKHKYMKGGRYTVNLTVKKIGTIDSASASIEVLIGLRPAFEGTYASDSSICSGKEIELYGFAGSYGWARDSFQFENIYAKSDFKWAGQAGQDVNNLGNGWAKVQPPLNAGDINYVLTVKDNFGCSHDTTLTLYGVSVTAKTNVNPTKGEAPLEVNLAAAPSMRGISPADVDKISYQWVFNVNTVITSDSLTGIPTDTLDPFETNSADSKYTLYRPGKYKWKVIPKFEKCSNVYSPEVSIIVDPSMLKIPNVFSPNGDGQNDFFQMVDAVSLKSFSGKILNRWGKVVYEWTNPKDQKAGWDGNDMKTGKPAPAGTYYYIISAMGWDDVKYEGTVNEKKYYGYLYLFR